MPGLDKPLFRLATTIHAQFQKTSAQEHPALDLPNYSWLRAVGIIKRLHLAERRGWHFACKELQEELRGACRDLQNLFTELGYQIGRASQARLPAIGDLYADLLALKGEFCEIRFDKRASTLSVTTEAITLKGVYLGPFTIELDWRGSTYRVVAEDANPASSDESVTHPHVQDEALCEGEGSRAIAAALEDGRLLDFFQLVAGVLRTYNCRGPYVPLSDWNGVRCEDCGELTDSEERSSCAKCGDLVCDGCSSYCEGCSDTFCGGCSIVCLGCDERYCSSCLETCRQCQARRCPNCLQAPERGCADCHDETIDDELNTEEIDEEELDKPRETDDADPALQPDRLGEAALLA